TNSAEIGWTANSDELSWLVSVNGVDTVVTSNPATITGLTPATEYTLSIQAICSETDSSDWSSTVAFTTACDAYTISESQPYQENFDSYTSGFGYFPDCWSFINASDNSSTYPQAYVYASTAYAVNLNCLYFKSSSTTPVYAVLPNISNNIENLVLSFVYKNEGTGGSNGTLSVGVMTDPSDAATFTEVYSCAQTTTRTPITINNFGTNTGVQYIAFKYIGAGTINNFFLGIDNVVVRQRSSENDILTFTLPDATQPSVIDAENHTVTAEISVSADITAQTPTITVSDYATISPLSGVVQDFTTPVVYTVTAEDASTQEWTVTVTQAVSASSANDIVAFTFAHQIGDAVIDTNNHTVNASAEWDYSLTAIAPTITVSDLATITPLSGVAQDFTAPVVYIVTAEDLTEQTWTVSIINDTTACPNPDGATMEMNIGATTATFTWSPIYLENSYNAKISTVAIDPANTTGDIFDQIVNDTTLTINGLTPNTTYYCYLQSNCGTIEWLEGSFTTPCEALTTFPFTEDFTSTTFPPACWMQERTAFGNTGSFYGTDYPNGAWARSTITNGNNSTPQAQLRDTRAGSKHNLVTTPLDMTYAGGYIISMDVFRNTSSNPTEGILVLVSSSDTIDATTDTLGFISRDYTVASTINGGIIGAETASGWYTYELPINRTGINYIIFEGNSQYGLSTYMDNISVFEAPTCMKPTDLHTNLIMPTSAEIGWTAINGETSWLVKVNGVDTLVTDNPATLLNLTANTDYTVQVRAICSETDSSQWTNPISFYTALCIPAPTSIDGQGITNVTFGQTQIVNNNTHPTAAPYYGDYTAQVGDGQQGMPVTVNITYATGFTYGTPIWVNWNNDCEFSDDELVYWGTSTNVNPTTLTASFTIPVGTPLGNYSMRIGGADSQFNDANNLDPCLSTTYTIYEDYTLQVTEAPSCLPVVDVEINNITAHEAEV
ncbi:MAG: GEVED domain-containing protein, partial [Bacteroidales bacterium]|nr:GEVED domain-containing protein [Bacteroidales bacterium]